MGNIGTPNLAGPVIRNAFKQIRIDSMITTSSAQSRLRIDRLQSHQWSMTSTVLRILLNIVGLQNVAILDELSQPYNVINRLRLLVYFRVM
jgi:hypothetical protein